MAKQFYYVIARPWEPNNPESTLAIYCYGQEVHKGTMKNAKGFLEYVKRMSPKEAEHYAIYKVKFKKV